MKFWELMLTQRHDADFWRPHIFTTFPNLDPSIDYRDHRNALRQNYERVRKIRNRLGHHESVANPQRFDLHALFDAMMETLQWRSHAVYNWVSGFETVQTTLTERPS